MHDWQRSTLCVRIYTKFNVAVYLDHYVMAQNLLEEREVKGKQDSGVSKPVMSHSNAKISCQQQTEPISLLPHSFRGCKVHQNFGKTSTHDMAKL